MGGGALAGAALLFFGGGLILDIIQNSDVPVSPSPEVPEPESQATLEPPHPSAGTRFGGPLGMKFRFVPAGTYWIGNPEAKGPESAEMSHQIELTRGFWLGETEVTQGQWREVAGNNPSYFKLCGEDCPVESVSWWEAVAFANLASDRENLERCYNVSSCTGILGTGTFKCDEVHFRGLSCTGYRLPTDSEWEVAARAMPGESDRSEPIYGTDLDSIAWHSGNSGSSTHRVGALDPNAWGFSDILGNVSEWTAEAYATYPVGGPARDPLIEQGPGRISRGGSWNSESRFVRTAYRLMDPPSSRWSDLGLRLARGRNWRVSPTGTSFRPGRSGLLDPPTKSTPDPEFRAASTRLPVQHPPPAL